MTVFNWTGLLKDQTALWQTHEVSKMQYLWLFVFQLSTIVVITQILARIMRPLRQPRFVAEILTGVILGPSFLGRIKCFAEKLIPGRVANLLVLQTMANIGLLYYLFLIGVQMDPATIRHVRKKAITIAVGGMTLPLVTVFLWASCILGDNGGYRHHDYHDWVKAIARGLFVGVGLATTSFSMLARMLAELKLLNTELGRTAMSSALISEICSWVLLALTIAIAEGSYHITDSLMISLCVVLSSVAFVAIYVFVVRPLMKYWLINNKSITPGKEVNEFSDFQICLILTGVMISGFTADAIGTHSALGAFMFGLIIPKKGPLGLMLIDRLEDFTLGLLFPAFFLVSGLRTDVNAISPVGLLSRWEGIFAVILGCGAKVMGTAVVSSSVYKRPVREGIALGLLMNTKGHLELIILNVGKDQKVLDDELFTIMVLTSIIMTGIITPIVTSLYRGPTTKFETSSVVPYKQRTIEKIISPNIHNFSFNDDADDVHHPLELRILTCIHTPRNVSTMINLLEAITSKRKSPLYVHVLHLVELTRRALLIVTNNTHIYKSSSSSSSSLTANEDDFEYIYNAFENYGREQQQEEYKSVFVKMPLTAISPYNTMHQDICSLAEENLVSFIIIPFHNNNKQHTGLLDGNNVTEGITNPPASFQTVNSNVLDNAPCSVGILVDRGFTFSSASTSPTSISSNLTNKLDVSCCNVLVLYVGGPDDREAIAYATRMSEHPSITINVIWFQFLPDGGEETDLVAELHEQSVSDQKQITNNYEEIQMPNHQLDDDEDYIDMLRIYNMRFKVEEVGVNSREQITAAITSEINNNEYDLFIVGRCPDTKFMPLFTPTRPSAEKNSRDQHCSSSSSSDQLGPIGDLLASSDFSSTISVLVIQQYAGPISPDEDEDRR